MSKQLEEERTVHSRKCVKLVPVNNLNCDNLILQFLKQVLLGASYFLLDDEVGFLNNFPHSCESHH